MKTTNNSHKTAMTRSSLSAPARFLQKHNLLQGKCLDYGCGKGYDCTELGIDGYDPYYERDDISEQLYDTIMCNFVLNVLPEQSQDAVLFNIGQKLKPNGQAYISVRNDKANLKGTTKIGTYQRVVELDLSVVKKTSSFCMYRMEKK